MPQAEAEIEGGVSPRVAPFADLRDLGALLQRAGFALPVTDVDRVTVRYASPLALMHDLRRMGATNALIERRRTPLRRATLQRMLEIYAERFADPDGRMRATFEIVWLSGWAPHESQQQPLRAGLGAGRGSPMRCGRRKFRRAKRPAAEASRTDRGELVVEHVVLSARRRARRPCRRWQAPMPAAIMRIFDRGRAALVGAEARELASGGRR